MPDLISQLNIFAAAPDCDKGGFFSFPTWYKYLDKAKETGNACAPKLTNINDIWLVLLAVVEILLRVAIMFAIAYVVIGGFKYVTSEGNPDKTSVAKKTVIDGLIGLTIAITATAVIAFIASRFQG